MTLRWRNLAQIEFFGIVLVNAGLASSEDEKNRVFVGLDSMRCAAFNRGHFSCTQVVGGRALIKSTMASHRIDRNGSLSCMLWKELPGPHAYKDHAIAGVID